MSVDDLGRIQIDRSRKFFESQSSPYFGDKKYTAICYQPTFMLLIRLITSPGKFQGFAEILKGMRPQKGGWSRKRGG